MKTLVTIDPRHIATGKRGSPCDCPVALAIKDLIADDVKVSVERDFITLEKHTTEDYSVDLPEDVADFIEQFDEGDSVEESNFTLDIPEAFLAETAP